MSASASRRVASAAAVVSPCVSICEMDSRTGLCRGCFRTLDEIAAWSVLDDDARQAVLVALAARRACCGSTGAR